MTPVIQPNPLKVSAYLFSMSSDKVSIRCSSFISSQVFRPNTSVTFLRKDLKFHRPVLVLVFT